VAYPGGRAFFAAGDPLLDTAHLVEAEDGTYTIDMHGMPDGVRIGRDKLTVEHLAALLEADPNWKGQPIRLLACETGSGTNSFAQRLADRLGVPVIAPTGYVGCTEYGTMFVTPRQVDVNGMPALSPSTGKMRTFRPRAGAPAGPRTDVLRRPETVPASPLDRRNPWGLRGSVPVGGPVRPGPRGLYFPDHEDLILGVNVDIGPDDPLPDGGSGGSSSGGSGGDSGDGGSGGDSGDDSGEGQDEQPSEETPPPPGEIPLYAGDEQLWPDELADLIAGNPAWAGGPIRLYVHNGQLDPAFVQRLADLLGVTVLVPPEDVVESFAGCSSGTLEVYNESEPVTPPGEGWHVFEPRTVAAVTTREAQ
jgi:hypothetical protein